MRRQVKNAPVVAGMATPSQPGKAIDKHAAPKPCNVMNHKISGLDGGMKLEI